MSSASSALFAADAASSSPSPSSSAGWTGALPALESVEPDGRRNRSPPHPLVRLAGRPALQLRGGLPRSSVRRDQQAQGLEDVQDARGGPPLARRGSDADSEGGSACRHAADAPRGRRGVHRRDDERRRSARGRANGTSPPSSANTSARSDSTSSPPSAAPSSQRSSVETSRGSRTSCSPREPTRARSGTRSSRSR